MAINSPVYTKKTVSVVSDDVLKERKFGFGCIEQWRSQRAELLARGRRLLRPTLDTLQLQPFLFGNAPTLADAALYGNLAMLEAASESHVALLSETLTGYMRRLESRTRIAR